MSELWSRTAGRAPSGTDPELRVDVRQVARHGSLAEEQRRRDLAVRPAFGSSVATLSSDGLSPAIRSLAADPPELERAAADQPAAPSASKPASADSIASRALRFWRARRRVEAQLGAGPSKGSPAASLSRTACSSSSAAEERSPRAAAISPRHSTACARTRFRPSRRPAASHPDQVRGLVDVPSLQECLCVVRHPVPHARVLGANGAGGLLRANELADRRLGVTAPEIAGTQNRSTSGVPGPRRPSTALARPATWPARRSPWCCAMSAAGSSRRVTRLRTPL